MKREGAIDGPSWHGCAPNRLCPRTCQIRDSRLCHLVRVSFGCKSVYEAVKGPWAVWHGARYPRLLWVCRGTCLRPMMTNTLTIRYVPRIHIILSLARVDKVVLISSPLCALQAQNAQLRHANDMMLHSPCREEALTAPRGAWACFCPSFAYVLLVHQSSYSTLVISVSILIFFIIPLRESSASNPYSQLPMRQGTASKYMASCRDIRIVQLHW